MLTVDCWLLVAILTSKCSVTMHVHDLFLGIFLKPNSSKQFHFFPNQFKDCFHASTLPTRPFVFFLFIFCSFYIKFIVFARQRGVAQNGHSHRAEKWHTMEWKVMYTGMKSDIHKAEKCRMGQNATLECYNERCKALLFEKEKNIRRYIKQQPAYPALRSWKLYSQFAIFTLKYKTTFSMLHLNQLW